MKRPISLAVRVFLLAFVPVCLTLVASFAVFRMQLEGNVKDGLRRTLVETQKALERVQADLEVQQQYLAGVVADNASLKAGIALWRETGGNAASARKTVEEQLLEISGALHCDLLMVFDARNAPVAAVVRTAGRMTGVAAAEVPGFGHSLVTVQGKLYSVTTAPVNQGPENVGALAVGRLFDINTLNGEAVLTHNGNVLQSNVPGATALELHSSLAGCGNRQQECETRLRNETFVVTPVESRSLGPGYALWNFQSLDAASAPLIRTQTQALIAVGAGTVVAAFLLAVFSSRWISRPITEFVERLKESERTGVLRGGVELNSGIREVDALTGAFNAAATSVADSQRTLDQAYLEFTQTMAQTLDARDTYTAGHSTRVSQYAVAVADAMNLAMEDKEALRVGATLHDIGKIGIPDAVLQKPGKLTVAEFEIIKRHPVIGKRILEGVARFRDYLAIIELHHENEDGTGYPWGLAGERIPLGARIVHVVDAFDAMTSSRTYREAMPPAKALEILKQYAGTQFDPAIVAVFLRLVQSNPDALPGGPLGEQLAALGSALGDPMAPPVKRRADQEDLRKSDVH